MLKQHKKALIASSLLILLPILVGLLLWNHLPEKFATHWDITGQADGWSSAPAAIFLMPLLMLASHWLCIFFTAKDPKNKDRNRKPFGMVLWIIPVVSNLTCAMMYALAMGVEFSVGNLMPGAMGLMFAVIGNYMPKMKMNSTMGIKVPWAYSSEENWNATHRFGGKCWVIGGIVMVLGAFLPAQWGVTVMVIATVVLSVIPIVYSYRYYQKQRSEGEALIPFPKMAKSTWIAIALLVIFLGVVLFAGELNYEFGEEYLTIDASFYSDLILEYASIESIEYRDGNVDGIRVGGFGSFRLLLGYFQNEEFGTYTRYTYYKPEACVVLTVKGKTLVLSGQDAAETQGIYQELLERAN